VCVCVCVCQVNFKTRLLQTAPLSRLIKDSMERMYTYTCIHTCGGGWVCVCLMCARVCLNELDVSTCFCIPILCVCACVCMCVCVCVCAEYSRMSVMSNSSEGSNPLEDSDAGLLPDQPLVNQQLRGRKVCTVCAAACMCAFNTIRAR
jgi:hypothetical protein